MKNRLQSKRVFRVLAAVFLMIFIASLVQASEQMKKDEKTDTAKVKREVNEALQAIKSYSIDKRDQAMAKAKEAMDKMDARINELEKQTSEKWQSMSESSREKRQQALRELRKKRNDIAEWYGEMKQSSAKAWDDVKKGFIKSYHSLQEAFDKAAKNF